MMTEDTERIEKLKLVADLWDRESDRFWVRNNIFLVIQTALLIVVTSFIDVPIICICVAILGIVFSFIWIQINRRGRYYIRRWEEVLLNLESNKDSIVFEKVLRAPTDTELKPPDKYRGVMSLMNVIISMIGIIWIIIIIYNTLLIVGVIIAEATNQLISRLYFDQMIM